MTDVLRLGIVGLDTSHAEQFTLRLNDIAGANHVPGARVVAAFPTPSLDLEESRDRVEGFTAALRDQHSVQITASLAEVCREVDAILLLVLDGRPRLAQMREILRFGKPVFMDKPVAASLADAVQIYRLAAEAQVPVFSASAVRWYPGVREVAAAEQTAALGAISYGPAHILREHPDLFFYGIHPTEALFTVMGSGCVSVTRTTTPTASVVTGLWRDGRVGTLHAIHEGAKAYKVVRFGREEIFEQKRGGDYTPLLREIVDFCRTGRPPVSAKETLELYAFMEAAEESKRRSGASVALREAMTRAGAPEEWLPEQGTGVVHLPKPTEQKNLPPPGKA